MLNFCGQQKTKPTIFWSCFWYLTDFMRKTANLIVFDFAFLDLLQLLSCAQHINAQKDKIKRFFFDVKSKSTGNLCNLR